MKILYESDDVKLNNRALNYGDGLFETILVKETKIPLLKYHLARLCNGAKKLGMNFGKNDASELGLRISELANEHGSSIIKCILTRGAGGRGYRSLVDAEPEVYVQVFPSPSSMKVSLLREGVLLRECLIRLSCQPALAGLKHLNRLENVLARNEWHDDDVFEGLLLDTGGLIIEATQANIFFNIGSRWVTPDLSFSGVSGVLRGWLLDKSQELGVKTGVTTLSVDDLGKARGCFVCNSVNGIVPVRSISMSNGNEYKFQVDEAYALSNQVRSVMY